MMSDHDVRAEIATYVRPEHAIPIVQKCKGRRQTDEIRRHHFAYPAWLDLRCFGLNGFLHFIPAPQYPGIAGQFIGAIFTSHFYIVVFLTQIVGGSPFLANRYVPLALLLLGPAIVNILNFHLSMLPKTIPLALVATALWDGSVLADAQRLRGRVC
jgi:hypothetical protein